MDLRQVLHRRLLHLAGRSHDLPVVAMTDLKKLVLHSPEWYRAVYGQACKGTNNHLMVAPVDTEEWQCLACGDYGTFDVEEDEGRACEQLD